MAFLISPPREFALPLPVGRAKPTETRGDRRDFWGAGGFAARRGRHMITRGVPGPHRRIPFERAAIGPAAEARSRCDHAHQHQRPPAFHKFHDTQAAQPCDLEATDVNRAALAALVGLPAARAVSVVGRRGAMQAAFTIKELRELGARDGARLTVDRDELAASDTAASIEECAASRPLRRKRDLLGDCAAAQGGGGDDDVGCFESVVSLRFLRAPVAFLPCDDDATALGAVVLEIQRLEGPTGRQVATPLGVYETIPADLALLAVGYAAALPNLDAGARATPGPGPGGAYDHVAGRVMGQPGLYCVGWAKRGPSGVVATNAPDSVVIQSRKFLTLFWPQVPDARETIASLVADLATSHATELPPTPLPDSTTTWADWRAIDKKETADGAAADPPASRIKLGNVDEMLKELI